MLETSPGLSPVLQTAVYMGSIVIGYILASTPKELAEARATVRDAWRSVTRGD